MNNILRPCSLIVGAVVLLAGQLVLAQTKAVKEVNARPTNAITGAELYREYCAVCHGADGHGNGPAADALKTHPNDITLLTRQNNSKFPSGHVQDVITGETEVAAHGSKDMPMWGDIFRSISINESVRALRISNLVQYIQSIQR